jgi:alpha-galactosidase
VTDEEYVTHFSMWAMMSSPLLIGTNVLTLTPASLAIYSNPAVIALNQDVSAGAGIQKWRYLTNDTDDYGQGEISLWTREMKNGDTVIALINGGNTTRMMNATSNDIFLDQSTAGTFIPAAELSETWDVYDLWANRLSVTEAGSLINGTAPTITGTSNSTTRYNATAMSYEKGLENNVTALFGTKIGTLAPHGTWTAQIPRHSTGLYRLRKAGSAIRKRDEL